MSFSNFGLDSRLEQALGQMGFSEPTPIQDKSIPLAIQDKKDIVAMARTGSGKTVAYLVPIIQGILSTPSEEAATRSIIFVPSRELADQVMQVLSQLTMFCSKEVRYVNVAQQVADKVRSTLLADSPHIVVATPSTARTQLEAGRIDVTKIEYVVFDEADLLVSYGYEDDLEAIHGLFEESGNAAQTWLMSATLGEDIDRLKSWFCKTPVTLRLQDGDDDEKGLTQYYVKCGEFDKFLLAYVIFKLGLIKGKTIIFVNDIDRGYRLKLFFEQVGIKSIVMNSELPVASRLHIVQEFNRNIYNLLIATDETHKSTKGTTSNEYGVSRGVDFKNVACVLNFDLPISSKAYTHRVGRTARAHKSGMALSFVVPKTEFGKHKIASSPTARRDEKVLERVIRNQDQLGLEVKPYKFDMKQVDSFRYRMEDAFRAVTRTSVREARVKELRQEILTSEKLKRHFEENPDDLAVLRHDTELHPSRVNSELKHVPSYLLPASAQVTKPIYVQPAQQMRPFKKTRQRRNGVNKKKTKKRDPLKSFGR